MGCVQGRMQGAAMAEGALRALLPETAQHRFQHLMRIVLNEFIIPLSPDAGGRYSIILALASNPLTRTSSRMHEQVLCPHVISRQQMH